MTILEGVVGAVAAALSLVASLSLWTLARMFTQGPTDRRCGAAMALLAPMWTLVPGGLALWLHHLHHPLQSVLVLALWGALSLLLARFTASAIEAAARP